MYQNLEACIETVLLFSQILQVLNVESNVVLSYPVNESHTIADVQAAIEEETGMPVADQDLILAYGVKLNPTDLALQGCCESVCNFIFTMYCYLPLIMEKGSMLFTDYKYIEA